QRLTVDAMKEYLLNPDELDCVVKIFHAKVAQKSYGNEKRFFCPPPSVYLSGAGWERKRKVFERVVESYNGYDTRCTSLVAKIGIMGSKFSEPQTLDFSNGKEFCPAKSLYVSDQDKRKFFHLQVHVSFNCSHNIGSFISDRIKVISKPSKKKQTVKGNDCNYLCINSGGKVALFNRLRSQTISTRYLHVENGSFHASPAKWGAFKIHLIDEDTADDAVTFDHRTGFVYYGNAIKLVDSCSDLSLPKMRIRKCDKNNVILDQESFDEPVSQLHRVAFQILDAPNSNVYLALNGDNIFQHAADVNEQGQHLVSEGAAWTIISAEKNEFRFYEAMGSSSFPVAPIPRIETMQIQQKPGDDARGVRGHSYMVMRGRDLHPKVKVWFGTIEANTNFVSNESLEVEIPSKEEVFADLPFLAKLFYEDGQLVLPVCLVREDGVIYYNDCSFSY
ncbi:UNVERIFIED_CONTAM: Recombining binding protein suppressor of hairless, partial [Eudyptes robustus]